MNRTTYIVPAARLALTIVVSIALSSCGKSATAQPTAEQVAQQTCRDNDVACLQAEAKAHEDAAARMLNGGETQSATVAIPQNPAPAAGGGLADGEYDCGGGYTFRAMGKVDIQGGKFRFRPSGDVLSGFAPYSVDGSGHITWGGHFGILDDAPASIIASTKENWGFNVQYQGTQGGNINTMSCQAPH